MVKDAGLACKYIIANKPQGAPVTERAIPLAIFQSEPAIRKYYLRKWLKDPSLQNDDIRNILDWSYYIERLGSAIQKIITIPAAMQGLSNPVPRVKHPDWLHKRVMEKSATHKQRKITDVFSVIHKEKDNDNSESSDICDVEDIAGKTPIFKQPIAIANKRKRQNSEENELENANKNWKDVLGSPPSMGQQKKKD
uniref:DNA polymerase epsilon catalytic subunit n=1 Tax=Apis cerana TaxID=7461 RepID=V9IM32_APICE